MAALPSARKLKFHSDEMAMPKPNDVSAQNERDTVTQPQRVERMKKPVEIGLASRETDDRLPRKSDGWMK